MKIIFNDATEVTVQQVSRAPEKRVSSTVGDYVEFEEVSMEGRTPGEGGASSSQK